MVKVLPAEETEVILAVREIFSEKIFSRRILSRESINERICDHRETFLTLSSLDAVNRRKKISKICNDRFQVYSPSWKTRSWVITAEMIA